MRGVLLYGKFGSVTVLYQVAHVVENQILSIDGTACQQQCSKKKYGPFHGIWCYCVTGSAGLSSVRMNM